MTTIYGFTELLTMGDFSGEQRQRMYEMMKRQGGVLQFGANLELIVPWTPGGIRMGICG